MSKSNTKPEIAFAKRINSMKQTEAQQKEMWLVNNTHFCDTYYYWHQAWSMPPLEHPLSPFVDSLDSTKMDTNCVYHGFGIFRSFSQGGRGRCRDKHGKVVEILFLKGTGSWAPHMDFTQCEDLHIWWALLSAITFDGRCTFKRQPDTGSATLRG